MNRVVLGIISLSFVFAGSIANADHKEIECRIKPSSATQKLWGSNKEQRCIKINRYFL